MKTEIKKQPQIKSGTEFTGYAIFNWGIGLCRVFPAQHEAKRFIIDMQTAGNKSWNDLKKAYRIVKVKCITQ